MQKRLDKRFAEIRADSTTQTARVQKMLLDEFKDELRKELKERTGEGTAPEQTFDFEPMTFSPLKRKGAKNKKTATGGRRRRAAPSMTAEESGFLGGFSLSADDIRMKNAKEGLSGLEGAWDSLVGVMDKAGDAAADTFDTMKDGSAEAQKAVEKREQETLAFEESKKEAQLIGLDAAIGVADQVGASSAVVSAMRAAMEIGEGLASLGPTPAFPLGNPAGAAAHFAAAAQFGVAAAMDGAGGGGGVASKGARSVASTDRLNRNDVSEPTTTNITLDFSRSVGVGPQAARELADEVSRGMSLSTGKGRVF